MTENPRHQYLESMLYCYETTLGADFRGGKFKPHIKPHYKPKPKPEPMSHAPLKYLGTLTQWKKHLPFDVMHKPKEILQTSPWNPRKPFVEPHNESDEIRRTRPRLAMTPAVCVDDVTDHEQHDVIIRDIYSTSTGASLQQAVSPYVSVQSPLPEFVATPNPIQLPKLKPQVVPREWRMESVAWDRNQMRSYVQPTKEFWLRPENAPTSCNACEDTTLVKTYRKLLHQK